MFVSKNRPLLLLATLLIIRLLMLGWYIKQGWLGLGPDEAQYWTWSHALDWGYYSKPLGIAWQIRAGCLLFGDTELGVRAGSLLIGTLLPLAVYGLGRQGGLLPWAAFWAGIIAAFTPIGTLATLLAITDTGMVFFWTLACYAPLRALRDHSSTDYHWMGLAIGLGALFKWPIYLLWLVVIVAMPFFKPLQRGPFWQGVALSLLGLLPTFIWNMKNGWVTFRHVGTAVASGEGVFKGNAGDFIGAQIVLLSPLFFLLLVAACIHLWRFRKREPLPLLFSGGTTALILGLFTAVAVFKKMQGNWCCFVYPLAFITVAWYGCLRQRWGKTVLQAGLALSLVLIAAALASPVYELPFRFQPFKHNLGWHALAPALQKAGYHPDENFLFADTYQTTSLLSFYGPLQRRAYFFNLQDHRHNQFMLWPSMAEEQRGKTGFFAVVIHGESASSSYEKLLTPYFANISLVGVYPLVTYDHQKPIKSVLIYLCEKYNGLMPLEAETY